jgi:hypothetical protein
MDPKNHAELRFVNPLIIELFGKYTDNSTMAEIVGEDGYISLSLDVPSDTQPPKTADDLLGLLYRLLAANKETAMGRVYVQNETALLRESISDFRKISDGFSDAELTLTVTASDKNDPASETTTTTEFKTTRSTTTETK